MFIRPTASRGKVVVGGGNSTARFLPAVKSFVFEKIGPSQADLVLGLGGDAAVV
jgi:hypothetical protein